MKELPIYVGVAVGGALGALGRAGATVVATTLGAESFWAVVLVNLVGCFAMGGLFVLLEARLMRGAASRLAAWPRAAQLAALTTEEGLTEAALETRQRRLALLSAVLLTGVLGGFTTFSSFSLDIVELLEAGRAVEAVEIAVASVGGSFLALSAGMHMAASSLLAGRR